jgi:hypothetical protein
METEYRRKLRWEGVNWILLAQYRDHWRASVNNAMNIRASIKFLDYIQQLINLYLHQKFSVFAGDLEHLETEFVPVVN